MLVDLVAPLISKILSLLQATTLRERYYTLEQRVEILETALEDIGRINADSNKLISGIVKNTLEG
jgi:hypothetical protein